MKKAKIILKILQVVLSVACIIISAYCWYKSLEISQIHTVYPDNKLRGWMYSPEGAGNRNRDCGR